VIRYRIARDWRVGYGIAPRAQLRDTGFAMGC